MSTAKSMAAQYLSKRQRQTTGKANTLAQAHFKSSACNLLTPTNSSGANNPRSKSTSMTNLVSGNNEQTSRIQRPASRNALDSIHNGMNAKYAQVQSKVLLQNIRPQHLAGSSSTLNSRIPATKENNIVRKTQVKGLTSVKTSVTNERAALLSKIKNLQEELDKGESEREELKKELERERNDKSEQLQQVKQELQEKLQEHERQNEDYHQKLLEAYELADQNRRAADSLLRESRQRDEESRKKVEEMESQLNELREFVAMKEEMNGKLFELREQLREERERYEEQLKSLHQVFENEKISLRQTSETNHLDQNSNYFTRIKPSLQSSESINKRSNCHKCQSGSSQLHCSEHDLYGSKLSTRMQDTARSAWKVSKQFASSVITGGVGISLCRERSSTIDSNKRGQSNLRQEETCVATNSGSMGELEPHTSVVEVGGCSQETSGDRSVQQLGQTRPQATRAQQASEESASVIHVDANNKLTIVTKFSESDLHQSSGSPELASSSTASERSRCESSSSGRGTSSDAGSAASQDGEETSERQNRDPNQQLQDATKKQAQEKKQRRKTALLKASKVFSGSQASINKLRSFFTGSDKVKLRQEAVEVIAPDEMRHLESSRLRCMELNQAIRLETELVDKVRQVGESYELSKYKTLNRTIELDARLANDRLLATKLRLNQVSALNDKLAKELRQVQRQSSSQERKLALAETMLRHVIDGRALERQKVAPQVATTSRFGRLRAARPLRPNVARHRQASLEATVPGSSLRRSANSSCKQVNSSATQTNQPSGAGRTRNIINELRQRLNLASNPAKAKGLRDNDSETLVVEAALAGAKTWKLASSSQARASSASGSLELKELADNEDEVNLGVPTLRIGQSVSLQDLLAAKRYARGELVASGVFVRAGRTSRATSGSLSRPNSSLRIWSEKRLSEEEKRRLLVEFLRRRASLARVSTQANEDYVLSNQTEVESAVGCLRVSEATRSSRKLASLRRNERRTKVELAESRRMVVQYELPVHSNTDAIALGQRD